jgi:hypothetical protein
LRKCSTGGRSGILEDGLLDTYQEFHDTMGDPVFQQDNAKIHTAADTMQWFEEHNIQVMEWPPNSPDLNLIHERYSTQISPKPAAVPKLLEGV